MVSNDSNVQLVERIRRCDKSAETELFRKFWRPVYFILTQRSKDPELAADIAQDAIIVTINKARQGEISRPEALPAFIHHTANNLLIASYRKQSRHKTDPLDHEMSQVFSQERPFEQQINQQQVRKLIQQILDELPNLRDKEILQRHFSYGHSKSEVCDALSLTPAHFDRVIYRAKSRLKQILVSQYNLRPHDTSMHFLLSMVIAVSFFTGSTLERQDSASCTIQIVRESGI